MLLYIVVFAFGFTVMCRAAGMDHETGHRVRWQYRLPLLLAALALPVFRLEEYSSVLLGLALCVFLWMERRNPRCVQDAPKPINHEGLRHVSGGRRD